MSKNQPEFELQAAVAEYLRTAYPKVKFLSDVRASLKLTIPQQVRAKRIQADNFACPDMVIFKGNRTFFGMFLEFKAETPYRKDRMLKADKHLERQWETLRVLRSLGYWADFYWTFDAAREQIDAYMSL